MWDGRIDVIKGVRVRVGTNVVKNDKSVCLAMYDSIDCEGLGLDMGSG